MRFVSTKYTNVFLMDDLRKRERRPSRAKLPANYSETDTRQ